MDTARIPSPPRLIAAAGVITAFAMLWAIQHARQGPPGLDEREGVREELSRTPGIQMLLPTVLPAGYDYGRLYSSDADAHESNTDTSLDGLDDSDGINGGLEAVAPAGHAHSRDVAFFPVEPSDPLPIVILCVQSASDTDTLCPTTSDRRHLQRHVGTYRVAIYAASKDQYDVNAWQAIRFTTHLDRVTWLH